MNVGCAVRVKHPSEPTSVGPIGFFSEEEIIETYQKHYARDGEWFKSRWLAAGLVVITLGDFTFRNMNFTRVLFSDSRIMYAVQYYLEVYA